MREVHGENVAEGCREGWQVRGAWGHSREGMQGRLLVRGAWAGCRCMVHMK